MYVFDSPSGAEYDLHSDSFAPKVRFSQRVGTRATIEVADAVDPHLEYQLLAIQTNPHRR